MTGQNPDSFLEPQLLRGPELIVHEVASSQAIDALAYYADRTHTPRDIEHPMQVVNILNDFAGDNLPKVAYDAALLHDLPSRFSDAIFYRNASRALYQYFGSVGDETRLQVATILADMEPLEDLIASHRQNADDNEVVRKLLAKGSNGNAKVPAAQWLTATQNCPVEVMNDVFEVHGINPVSVLIVAAEMYDKLVNRAPGEASVLKNIRETEAIIAPMLEIFGYDGFAMALRDASAGLRFTLAGRAKDLKYRDMANELVAPFKSEVQVNEVIQTIFGVGNIAVSSVVKQHSHQPILVGDAAFDLDGDIQAAAWRVKSKGSIAYKMRKYDGETPADIFGMTVISPNIMSSALAFGGLLTRIRENPALQLNETRTRSRPVEIRGEMPFAQSYLAHILDEGVDLVSQRSGFRVAKISLLVNTGHVELSSVPVEVQFATKQDRTSNRVGATSHLAYKVDGGVDNYNLLGSIYDQKAKIRPDTVELTVPSIQRGTSFLRRIDRLFTL